MKILGHAMHDRQSLSSILILGVFLAGNMEPASAQSDDGLFEQYEVVTGASNRQTVLPGFFLGGTVAELAVLHIDENSDRRLQMYGFDGVAWQLVLETKLRPRVLFVDVANIDGRDRLITFENGRLSWFDTDSTTERALAEVAIQYKATAEHEIPHIDITRDLNHDGRDDLVVPDVDGFWISTQLGDGSFADALKLGPPEPFLDESVGQLDLDIDGLDDSASYGDVGITSLTAKWYLSRVHEMDYNQDGRSDLVFWNEDHFDVYTQDEQGLFDAVAKTFTTEVLLDSDGAYSRMFEYSDKGPLSLIFGFGENTKRTMLHSLCDLNGDRVADMVTLTLSGRSMTKQRSVYEVYFGRSIPGGMVFARDVGTAINSRGKAGGMQPWGYASQSLQDLDGDGQVDMMLKDVAVGIGGMVRTLTGSSVPIDLEFYRFEDAIYRDRPTTRRKIRRFAPFDGLGNIFFPAVLIGDVNGDGRSDLIVGQNPEELHVYLGVPGPDLLARKPQKVTAAMPYDERNTWLVDLNKDDRQDLLILRAPTDHSPTEPHQVTILIAR